MSLSHLAEVHLRKAETAAEDGNLTRAKDLYAKAIGCYGDRDAQSVQARLGLAAVHAEEDELDAAWSELSAALEVLERGGSPIEQARALNQMGLVRRRQEAFDEAAGLHVRARAVAAGANDLRQQAVALRNLAAVERARGAQAEAVVLLREAAELLIAEGERRGVALIWRQVRGLELELGRLREACQAAEAELVLREALGEGAAIGATLLEAAEVARLVGQREDAEAWLARAAELRLRSGDMEGAARALVDSAWLLLFGARPRGARRKLEAARDAIGEAGPIDLRAELWRGFAETDLALLEAYVHPFDPLGRVTPERLDAELTTDDALEEHQLQKRARDEAEEALALSAQSGSGLLRAAALRATARACDLRGDAGGARGGFRAAVTAAEELGPQPLSARLLGPWQTFLDYGAWLGRAGSQTPGEAGATDRRAAVDYLGRAAILAEEAIEVGLSPVYAARARAALALHHLRAGEPGPGKAALTRARELLAPGPTPDPLTISLRHALDDVEQVTPVEAPGTSSDELLQSAGEVARLHVAAIGDERLRDALYDLRRLQEITRALTSELDLRRLLDLILDVAVELVGAERGFLIVTSETGEVEFKAARNIERTQVERPDRKVSNTIARLVIEGGLPVVTGEAGADDRLTGALSVAEQQLRSVAGVPLRVRGRVIGALYLDHRYKPAAFGVREVELLEGLAAQAAVALENAKAVAAHRVRRADLEVETERLSRRVESQTTELATVRERLEARSRAEGAHYQYDKIVGRSEAMAEVFQLLDKVVPSTIPVFIQGESGTGKELIARAIHHNGPRQDGPFVSENFAAIVDELVASELFGHVKGSFTGALENKQGLFQRAHGGTIFLDEVGDLSEQMQKELLRVLEERCVRPVGASEPIDVDVRLISATHRDLGEMVKQGTFRQDLFYRLHVFAIRLPPLRDRRQDIPLLAERFLEAQTREQGTDDRHFNSEALRRLMAHDWPGNVRELKNVVDRTALLAKGQEIEADDVALDGFEGSPGISTIDDLSLADWSEAKEAFAKRYLSAVLARVGGNISVAARETGMLRQAFQRLLKRHEVDPATFRPRGGSGRS